MIARSAPLRRSGRSPTACLEIRPTDRTRQAGPASATVVVHPCDEASLRGPVEAAEAGIIVPLLVGPAAKIADMARACRLDIGRLRDRRREPHSEAAAAKAVELIHQGKGRAADERQPAYRRVDARGDVEQDRVCAPRDASAMSSSWTCRRIRTHCSSPTRRSTSSPTSTPSATSFRTRSTSSPSSDWGRRGSRSFRRSKR